ncbi:MAG: PIN domain-containing protein [Halobacteriales archaeon]|nr:PIN domain-containing protein [Halobacteriales archaeon]
MYLDTDVILARIKDDDWLKSEVDRDALTSPKTSAVTVVEVQLVYFDERSRGVIADSRQEVSEEVERILPLDTEVLEESSRLLREHDRLNVFDSLHLAHASVLDEPIVSTDTLYPEIEDVRSLDPRELAP